MEQLPGIDSTYHIIEELGAGSGGTVYLAYHANLKKNVVLKKMKTKAMNLLDARAETDILKNLHHQYLPQVLNFIEYEDGNGELSIYTVMDYIPGDTLNNYLKQGRRFTPTQVAKYMTQLTEAVDYLHSRKVPIIHGDIKPSNIMLTPEDHIVLIDFNISSFSDTQEFIACTKEYAPPEQREAVKENRERRKLREKQFAYQSFQGSRVQQNGEDDSTQIDEETAATDDATVIDADETIIAEANVIDEDQTVIDAESFTETEDSSMPIIGLDFKPVALIDQRSDIYSIGAAMYPLLTGEKPNIDYEHRRKIADSNLNISEGLVYVVDKAMELRPEKRFQNTKEMLNALQNIAKKDKRYKREFVSEVIFCFFFVIMAAGSALTAYKGYQMMKEEKAETMYDIAYSLHEQKDYEADVKYILTEALADTSIYDFNTLGNLYYLIADSSYELGEYDAAASFYDLAVTYNNQNPEYYCNYAISLARMGKIDEADGIITLAEKMGLEQAQIYLMKAEIANIKGNYKLADENYRLCRDNSEDDYLTYRAYVLNSMLYSSKEGYSNSEYDIEANINLLEEASVEVGEAYLPVVLEQLMEAYNKLYEVNGEEESLHSAVKVANRMIDGGWKSFNLYINLGQLYDRMGEFEKSIEVYDQTLEQYGENYILYKQMAFLRIDIENAKEVSERNYLEFAADYKKAIELIEKSGVQKDSDMDMVQLEEFYRSLIETGWLVQE